MMNGTGLGLSISKKIMEMHGGSILVNSELNVGSVFSIVFPSSCITDQPVSRDTAVTSPIHVAVSSLPIISPLVPSPILSPFTARKPGEVSFEIMCIF